MKPVNAAVSLYDDSVNPFKVLALSGRIIITPLNIQNRTDFLELLVTMGGMEAIPSLDCHPCGSCTVQELKNFVIVPGHLT